jgi:glucokinase-like ROK family protein
MREVQLKALASGATADHLGALVTVLDLVRDDVARTRRDLSRQTGLGRTVIAQRVRQLIASDLLAEDRLGPSSGGRAPRELRFRSEVGHLLVADLGATSISAGIGDLRGEFSATHEEPADVAAGPEVILDRVEGLFDEMLAARPNGSPPIWGIGIGVPGPVEFATARPISPPIMPGWDQYPIRDRFTKKYGVPTWVDNDVNLMALGEFRRGVARGTSDAVFVKLGSGIGAGLISMGRLHRGAQGAAGDVGHVAVSDDRSVVCRCGNIGCLEALAGGAALGWQATAAAREGRSKLLAEMLLQKDALEAADVSIAAAHGDSFAVELLNRAGSMIGGMVATLVNFYNPAIVIIGGGMANAGDLLLAAIRQAVYQRSLPLATRDLRIVRSTLGGMAGLYGAAYLVTDEIFSRTHLLQWIDSGSPIRLLGTPALL